MVLLLRNEDVTVPKRSFQERINVTFIFSVGVTFNEIVEKLLGLEYSFLYDR